MIPLTRIAWPQHTGCPSRKVVYLTPREARCQANVTGGSVYHCRDCDLWHITVSIVGGERKRRATKRAKWRRIRERITP